MPNKKNQHTVRSSYIIAIIASLGFLVLGLLIIVYMGGQSRQETMQFISAAVEQNRFNVDSHISEELQTLGTGMIMNEEREWTVEDESFDRMTKRLLGSNTYTRVGIAEKNGNALWADRNGRRGRADLSAEPFIRQALAGKNAVSESQWDELSGVYVNYYAIPAYAMDGTLRGVLFAADPESELRAIMDNSLFAGEGFAQIINRDGSYVIKSDSLLRLGGDGGIFDLPMPIDPEVKQKVLDDMAAGRPGYLMTKFEDDSRMAAYAPSRYNDWYVFYSVQEDVVNAGMQNILNGAISVIVIAGCVFLFFILLIRRDNNRNRKELERLAFVDPLTGGPNLQKFKIDAQKILEKPPGGQYAVCYADIKGFKFINDIFSRDVGDQLLCYLWQTFSETVPPGELHARAGNDVFVALRRMKSMEIVEQESHEIMEKLADFPPTAARGYKVEIYGGMYIIDPKDGNLSLDDMLDRAIEAQREVKRHGNGSRIGVYSNAMRGQHLWDTEVESRMERALENNEFKMYLQPKINIQDGNIMGMEALVRWEPPGQAQIPPSRFIGLFESNGFIIKLDRYMVEEACRVYREQRLAEIDPPPVLSVNVSRLSLLQPDIVQVYTAIKERYGIPDGLIELEFTEGLLFENHARFREVVEGFQSAGFLCSLDDFGSGYSSLNILKSLRVDVLKLDKLFFEYGGDEIRGRELVRTMVSLAKFLNIKTVAEGIENEDEVRWLREIGCDAIQGYVFSKPLPLEGFLRFLERWKIL